MAGQIIMSSVVQTTDWMVKTVKLFYILTHAIITLSLFILNPLFEGPKRLLLLFVLRILALFMGIQEEFLIKSGL